MKEAGDDDKSCGLFLAGLTWKLNDLDKRPKTEAQETATIGARSPKRTHDPLGAI